MAKRARGSVRPGQRRPIDRRPASSSAGGSASSRPASAATPRPSGLSEGEIARAAEIEAQLLAEEKAAETARTRNRERAATREMVSSGPSGSLARAATEYAYVARDVKDIVRIASLLIGILVVLWVLIDVAGVISIGG